MTFAEQKQFNCFLRDEKDVTIPFGDYTAEWECLTSLGDVVAAQQAPRKPRGKSVRVLFPPIHQTGSFQVRIRVFAPNNEEHLFVQRFALEISMPGGNVAKVGHPRPTTKEPPAKKSHSNGHSHA